MEDELMVTAGVIAKEFAIPRSTLYRLVKDGRVPAHDVTQPWHDRRQLRFRASEVRQAIESRPKRRPTTPPG